MADKTRGEMIHDAMMVLHEISQGSDKGWRTAFDKSIWTPEPARSSNNSRCHIDRPVNQYRITTRTVIKGEIYNSWTMTLRVNATFI